MIGSRRWSVLGRCAPRRMREVSFLVLAAGGALIPTGLLGVVASGATTPQACATAGLDLWMRTDGSGAAGSVYYDLELTNLSGATCTVTGYPGVSGVDLAGHQIGAAANRNPAIPSKTVTLAPGASSTAVVQIVDVANYPAATCVERTAAGLRVFPPDQRASKVIPYPFAACAHRGARYLSIEAVQSGLPPGS